MRIQGRETVEGGAERITLVPETVDDLWHLTYVIEPGDRVAGDTTRRIRQDDDRVRDTGGRREPMWAVLAVDDVEFHRFANRLRVSGEIVSCSREDQLGAHHTLNVETREELSIQKHWKPDQLDRLEEAVEASETPDVAIATVEEGEATVYAVAQHGTEELASIVAPTGKGEDARARSELFAELTSVLTRLEVEAIILAGPGFTKADAFDYLEEHAPEVAELTTLVDTSAAGDRGVHEVLARGAVADAKAETRIAKEAELIDELLRRMKTGVKVAYGPAAVHRATEFGAVEHLLVVDEQLRTERAGEGDWPIDADELVESVDQQGGEVTVFSGEFDPGRQLANLGGVAALLRYRID